ncbi:hypothetical protein NIGALANA_291 [Bacillus phage Nigalana]|uniref:Uncharacterized protein n=2 Tax=Wphvirus TaxID=1922327 RepID=A0A222Z148_9CAUD|nr:hypothetical protein BIZ89_gp293 [Bacillus phage Kida]YP_009281092.1 hypothetical protein SAGEFAYGE_289 [Bacillus phage SageFayge]YP_009282683.1 hypothetical protein BI005_gp291 [Bacillus phage Nigalana]YP_009284613.1 hypothetical protein BI004_gp285 [Bacillus phage NotTheCreek]YP_009287167.1 hypothetical protein BI006_gp291 [Bacillus phage Nemo]ASR78229.1 hypothetical protein PPISBEST_290 [Bacillus phage PPIsBest]ASR78506.1 hypothetical protein BUBS_292 [Bacillus phage Bubs]ASR79120.1 hy
MKPAKKIEYVHAIDNELRFLPHNIKVSRVWNGADFCGEEKAETFVNLLGEGDYKKAATKFTKEELQGIWYFAQH